MIPLTFRQYLIEFKPIFRYVYHIAPTSAIQQIKTRGLIPTTQSSQGWSHITYDKPSIFVFTRNTKEIKNELLGMLANKYGDPQEYTNAQWDHFLDTHVMLTIDLSKCNNIDMHPDPKMGTWHHSCILTGEVPASSIISIDPVNFDWT